ncbi:MAG: quinone oxidoreductase [Chloroflexota bacterium]
MKVISFSKHGTPDVLRVLNVDVPAPTGNQVLVRNHAIGVNYVDVQHRQGGYYEVELPLIPGIEAAGTVEAVGETVSEFATGDRVAYAGYMGGNYAEYTLVPEDRLFPVPDGIGFDVAAASVLQGITAYVLTHHTYPVQRGDWMLVHAAAGGVGSLLTQMGHYLGATVIGTVSTEEKAQFARQMGANHLIRYTEVDFEQATNQITDDVGVHVVYDAIGKTTFDKSLACLRKRGMMVVYGQSSGAVPPFDINRLSGITLGSGRGSLFLTWAAGSHYIEARQDLLDNAQSLFNLLLNGHIQPHIADRLPLTEAPEAHRRLEARRVMGKLVLIP